MSAAVVCFIFFFNDTATTEIYTLSLHDALPIWEVPIIINAYLRSVSKTGYSKISASNDCGYRVYFNPDQLSVSPSASCGQKKSGRTSTGINDTGERRTRRYTAHH